MFLVSARVEWALARLLALPFCLLAQDTAGGRERNRSAIPAP